MDEFYEFFAGQVFAGFDEGSGCWLIGLSDQPRPDPEVYLILQRAADDEDEDLYYYEINGREAAGYGGFASVTLADEMLTVEFSEPLRRRYETRGLRIGLRLDEAERERLHTVLGEMLADSDCTLSRHAG